VVGKMIFKLQKYSKEAVIKNLHLRFEPSFFVIFDLSKH